MLLGRLVCHSAYGYIFIYYRDIALTRIASSAVAINHHPAVRVYIREVATTRVGCRDLDYLLLYNLY